MIKYRNKMIAAVGHYLISSNGKRGFSIPIEEGISYTEKELTTIVEKRPYNSVSIGGVFNIKVTDNIKKTLITSIWSNDDQIAIMLNKDNGDNEMYNFMQEWRKWFSDIVHNIEKLYNTERT